MPFNTRNAVLLSCLVSFSSHAQIDLVKVDKSKRRMYLIEQGVTIKEYRIALGKSPKGHKQVEGDQKTPEGRYILNGINPNSSFYKSIHIDYPNQEDMHRAKQLGTSAGGDISIHGIKSTFKDEPNYIQSFDWTNGCIAITNDEMDEFLALVDNGTPIEIEW